MPRIHPVSAFTLAVLLVMILGCSRHEEPPVAPEPAKSPKRLSRVVIPQEVKGKWQAVKIAVLDKDSNEEQIYTVGIGSDFAVADSDIRVKLLAFLPAFIMDDVTMTSASNETRNPAVQIRILEQGKKVFEGWLFSLYPATHAFQHPRFSFTLVDFIPVDAGDQKE